MTHQNMTNGIRSMRILSVVALCFSLLGASISQAADAGITYQGRILKPNGDPLSGTTVQFRMQIRTPGAQNCLMFEELHVQDLSTSNGNFSLTINDGNGNRTDSSTYGLDRIFANRGTFTFNPATCTSGSNYSPNEEDGRKLVVFFKDETMASFEQMPAQNINFVPLALESKQVQGFTAASLVRVQEPSGGALGNIAPLSNANYTELLALIGGTTAQYEKAGKLSGITMPSMTSGHALGWNGSSWTSVDPLAGVQAFAKTALPTCAAGAYIRNNAGALECTTPAIGGGGTVTEVRTGTGLTGGPINSDGEIALATLNAGGTGFKVTYDTYGRVTAAVALAEADIPQLSAAGKVVGSAITSGTIGGSTAINTTGTITSGAISSTGLVSSSTGSFTALGTQSLQVFETTNAFKVSVVANSATGNYTLTLPVNAGANGQVLTTNGSGVLTWTSPSSGSVTSLTGDVTSTGSGAVATTIANSAVTFAKIQNVPTASIVGRYSSGSGAPESLTVGAGLALSGAGVLSSTITDTDTFAATLGACANGTVPLRVAGAWTCGVPTPLSTNSALVQRDGTGNFAANVVTMNGLALNNAGSIVNLVNLAGSAYTLTMPVALGTSGQVLGTSGSGQLTWTTPAAPGTGDFKADGTVPMTGNLNLNGKYLSGDGGSEGIFVAADGNVGIGTTSPGSMLAIEKDGGSANLNLTSYGITGGTNANAIGMIGYGGTKASPTAILGGDIIAKIIGAAYNGTATTNSSVIAFRATQDQTPTAAGSAITFETTADNTLGRNERLRINQDGNVGIGTKTPTGLLTLNGADPASVSATGQLHVIGSATTGAIDTGSAITLSGHDGTTGRIWGSIQGLKENATSGNHDSYLRFGTRANGSNITEKMRITSAGNVGIGTNNPTRLLQVVTNAAGTQGISTSNSSLDATATSDISVSSANAGLSLSTYSAAATGAFGTVPKADLALVSTWASKPVANMLITTRTAAPLHLGTDSVERISITAAGSVGIGTTLPLTKLDVAGAVKVADTADACIAGLNGAIRFNGGNLQYCVGTAWTTLGAAGAGLTALTGDVTASGSGSQAATIATGAVTSGKILDGTIATADIANGNITFAKIQNVPTASIAGRFTTGTGDLESLTLGTGLALSGAGVLSSTVTDTDTFATALGACANGTVPLRAGGVWTCGVPTPLSTSSALVQRDGSGNFAANVVTMNGLALNNAGSFVNLVNLAGSAYTLTMPVGLGTAGQVLGTSGSGQLTWNAPASGSQWTTTGSDIYYNTGKVGIGTTAPGNLLTVQKDQAADTSIEVRNQNSTFAANTGIRMFTDVGEIGSMSAASSSNAYPELFTSRLAISSNATNGLGISLVAGKSNADIRFATGGYAAGNERMRISTNGNVGIGTTTPLTGERLHVAGGAIVAGPQGTGANSAGELRLKELAAGGTNYVGFRSPDGLAGDYVWTLPTSLGTNGQVLTTNASGALSWSTPAAAATGDFKADGSVPMTGNLQMGTSSVVTQQVSAPVATTVGRSLTLAATDAASSGNKGGTLYLNAGSPTAYGNGDGGDVIVTTGSQGGTGTGGAFTVNAGQGAGGGRSGGSINLNGGTGPGGGGGGSINLTAGSAPGGGGGNIVLTAGTGGIAGVVDLKSDLHLSGSTSGYVGFRAPATAGSTTYTWPSAPTAGYVLSTNGTGTLSWIAAGGGGSGDFKADGSVPMTGNLTVNVGATLGAGVKVVGTNAPLNGITNGTYNFDFGLATCSTCYSSVAQANDSVIRTMGAPSNGNLILANQNATGSILFTTGTTTTNDTAKVAITNGGNVGIGTSSPYQKLDVHGTNEDVHIGIQNNSSTAARYPGVLVQNYSGGFGGAPTFTGLASRGNSGSPQPVQANDTLFALNGLGATNTSYGSGTGAFIQMSAAETFSPTAHGTNISFSNVANGTTALQNRMFIRQDGNVGIGTTGPTQKLEVNGNVLATAYMSTSDRRLKKDFVALDHSLENLAKLNTVKFRWITPANPEADREQIGLIAQDVREVYPQAVQEDSKGILRVNYMSLIAPMIDGLRDLYHRAVSTEAKTAELEKQVADLKTKNQNLEDRLSRIEQSLNRAPASAPKSK